MPATKTKAKAKARARAAATTKRTTTAKRARTTDAVPASRRIDDRIRSLGGWRGATLAAVRRMIHEADPEIVEECKWVKASNPAGVPVWSHAGIVCTGEAYKDVVKLTFARGASLKDPARLFNASLDAGTRRAIDIREGHALDPRAFKALIQAAVAANVRANASRS